MLGLDQPVLDVELRAGIVEGVSTKEFAGRERLFDVVHRRAGLARMSEREAQVRQDGVDAVGHRLDQGAQDVAAVARGRLLVQLDKGKLGNPVDRHEQVQLALRRPHLGDVPLGVCRQTPRGQGMWKEPSG